MSGIWESPNTRNRTGDALQHESVRNFSGNALMGTGGGCLMTLFMLPVLQFIAAWRLLRGNHH